MKWNKVFKRLNYFINMAITGNLVKKILFNSIILNSIAGGIFYGLQLYMGIDFNVKNTLLVYTFTFIVLTSDLIKIMIFVFFQFVRYFNYNVKSGIIGINQVVLDQLYDETERPKLQKTLKSLECND